MEVGLESGGLEVTAGGSGLEVAASLEIRP